MVFRGELFQDRLLLRECFACGFVCFVGREPNLVTQGNRIIVEWKKGIAADPLPEIAVLFVIAEPHHHAEQAHVDFLILARSAEGGFRNEIFHIAHAVFEIVRRPQLIHFQLRLGAFHFRE